MRALKDYATPMSVLILAGVLLFDHFATKAVAPLPPAVDGQSVGKAYAPALLLTYANAWVEAAKALEEGKTVAEAQKALQNSWKDGRTKAFQANVEPVFAGVLPAGTEPANPAQRASVAQLWRAFAKGLTGGH